MIQFLANPFIRKIAIGGLALAAIGGVIYAGYVYVTNLQNELAARIEQTVKLEQTTLKQQETINQMIEDSERKNAIISNLNEDLKKARDGISDLQDKFNKTSKLLGERDIGKLAVGRPELIEKVINKGTSDVNRCFEILSGAPLTGEEINADRPSKSNTSCPSIANPNLIVE